MALLHLQPLQALELSHFAVMQASSLPLADLRHLVHLHPLWASKSSDLAVTQTISLGLADLQHAIASIHMH
jgi:hypothetical protein